MPQLLLTASGSFHWVVPSDCTEMDVEVWGGGGDGDCGGGGGGGYTKKNSLSVTPGNVIDGYIGISGENSWFVTSSTYVGGAGGNASGDTHGTGGSGSGGDVSYSGGNGADGTTTCTSYDQT